MGIPVEFLNEIRAEVTLKEYVSRTVKLRKDGRNYKGCCPLHKENTPSFTIFPGNKFQCFGCGEHGDVIDFVQKTGGVSFLDAVATVARDAGRDLPNGYAGHIPSAPQPRTPIVLAAKEPDEVWEPRPVPSPVPPIPRGSYDAVYEYRAPNGHPLGYVTRKNHVSSEGKRTKTILPFTWGWLKNDKFPEGRETWHRKHMARPLPLYGLDRLAGRPEAPVLVVEGEKDCDAAEAMFPAYVCVTWPRGTANVQYVDWEPLARREVVVWPDNDPPFPEGHPQAGHRPGQEAAAWICETLSEIGATPLILDISGLPDKFGAADLQINDPEAWLAERIPAPSGPPDMEAPPADAYEEFDESPPHIRVINQTVKRFNEKYALVNEDGKVVIFQFGYDNLMKRKRIDRLSTQDFNTLYLNEKILTQPHKTDPEKDKYSTTSRVWLSHKNRRQYINGVMFNPTQECPQDGVLNLWEGFALKPVKGDWSLLRAHIFSVICLSDQVKFDFLMGWMARMVQSPAEQGEVAVVMKGGEGTGKGTLAKALIKIIGQHSLAISNAKHLVSNFNGHLRDAIFLFADEAFFAGDRAHVGVLKSIITEPYLTVEAKFQNATQMPNFLHIMMASNEEWVVPAAVDARRFFVLEVGDEAKNNHTYFAEIWRQMDSGGYAGMLHDLLTRDLSAFNVRDVPRTEGLANQQKLSLGVPELWWKDCLERGYIFKSKLGLDKEFSVWYPKASTELLHASYSDFSHGRRERNPMSRETLGRFMVKMGGVGTRFRNAAVGEHLTDELNAFGGTSRAARSIIQTIAHGYAIGLLEDARMAFCEALNISVEWEDFENEM